MTDVVTPEMVAERWKCSPRHVRDLMKEGELRYFRIGRMLRVSLTALKEFEECQNESQTSSHGGSPDLKGNSASPETIEPMTEPPSGAVIDWEQKTAERRKPARRLDTRS
jgi:excisionase family DNA binding protein